MACSVCFLLAETAELKEMTGDDAEREVREILGRHQPQETVARAA